MKKQEEEAIPVLNKPCSDFISGKPNGHANKVVMKSPLDTIGMQMR